MIKLTHVEYVEKYRLLCEFSDGMNGVYDLEPLLLSFETQLTVPLRSLDQFTTFFICSGALCWKNGLELDPQAIYAELQKSGNLKNLPKAA
jgi:hypothetical protein